MWTDEKIEILRRYYKLGMTAKEIGEIIGVSRNAVIGKANRLNLKQVEKNRAAVVKKWPGCPPEMEIDDMPSIGKRMHDHRAGECLYAIGAENGSHLFCCAATDGGPYCQTHKKSVYALKRDQK